VEDALADVKITVNPNGPYWVQGNGHSNNKPLCDGSHARVAFNADTKAPVPGGSTSPSGS
jgi:CDGSH-type Zn-finger protein